MNEIGWIMRDDPPDTWRAVVYVENVQMAK